jgi:hypothetical protein
MGSFLAETYHKVSERNFARSFARSFPPLILVFLWEFGNFWKLLKNPRIFREEEANNLSTYTVSKAITTLYF